MRALEKPSSAPSPRSPSKPRKRLSRSHSGSSTANPDDNLKGTALASEPARPMADTDTKLPSRLRHIIGDLGKGLLGISDGLVAELPESMHGSTSLASSTTGSLEPQTHGVAASWLAPEAISHVGLVKVHGETSYEFKSVITDNTFRVLVTATASRSDEETYDVVIKIFSNCIHFQEKSYAEGPLALRNEHDAHKSVSDYNFSDKDHVAVVPLLATFQDEEFIYIVMPQYQMSLAHLIGRDNPDRNAIPLHHVKQYMAELVASLSFMYKEQNMFHCDLKPDNVLLDRNGHLALADFGLATPFSSGLTDRKLSGTPGYIAPEIGSRRIEFCNHGEYDILPTEIWSLGCIMYELLTGEQYENPINLIRVYRNLWDQIKDKDALDLLLQLLNQNPAQRPSIEEIKSHRFFNTINWKHLYLMPARDFSEAPRGGKPLPPDLELLGVAALFEEHRCYSAGMHDWPPRLSEWDADFMRHFWTYRDVDKINWECSSERRAQFLAAVGS